MADSSLHTVLTGDVVKSRELSREERAALPDRLRRTFARVRSAASLSMGFDVYRGDAWQMYVRDPRYGLRVAVHYRAALRALADIDVRVALVIDTVDFVDERPGHLGESDGAAFRRSGYALDHLGRRTMACLLPEGCTPSVRQLLFNTIASAAGAFISRWTPAQSQAVALTLALAPDAQSYASQEQVAAAWEPSPITQQAVSGHLRRAEWSVINEYLENYASEVEKLIDEYDREDSE